MKPHYKIGFLLMLMLLLLATGITFVSAQSGGGYTLLSWKVAGGGSTFSTGGSYRVGGTIGQHDAGTLSGGSFTVRGGFWSGFAAEVTVSPTLDLAKSVSSPSAAPGQTVTYTLSLTATGQTIATTLTDTLPISMTYVNGSATGSATYDAATRQIRFNGSIVPGASIAITYRATVDLGVPPGSVLANDADTSFMFNGAAYHVHRTAAVVVPNPMSVSTLVLIYANGDGDLSTRMVELFNRAEQSAANPNAVILLLLDGPADDDARLYRVQSDSVDGMCPNFQNPTCNGRYVLGQNMWHWSDDVANAYSLSEFLLGGIRAYPNAAHVIVSLVGHGSGWFPNVLLGQPSAWDGQPGGLLYDTHPHSYLTTKALGDAFRWVYQATGRKVDLLYLDACLMSMSEVTYEVSDSVNYVLASENWTWTAFPYDAYLSQSVLDGTHSVAAIGADWLAIQAQQLRSSGDYPFTLALIDESQLDGVRNSIESLATALSSTLPIDHDKIVAAQIPGICFDSNQDGVIDTSDNYCDLSGLARHLASQYSANPTVVNAANTVQTAVAAAVLVEDHQNGVPWNRPNVQWTWENLGGLSVYAPFHMDDWKRAYYNGNHLRFAENGQWGALLNAFWNASPPPPPCTENCAPPPPPIDLAPISLQTQAGHDNILITWQLDQPVNNLVGYHVLRQSGTTTATAAITLTATPVLVNQYTDAGSLTPGSTYCYQVKGVNGSGAIVAQSGLACATYGQVMIWTPNMSAPPGATNVLVPINLSHGDGLCIGALDVSIRYSTTIVTASGLVTPTIYSQGYAFAANTSTPGEVSIAAINSACTPLYGPGTLFNVGFNAVGAQGQISPIDFITGITYTVIYDDSDLVHPVPLTVEDGSITIGSVYVRGDVNGDSAINAADALLALRIASGQIIPTLVQQNACDANGDGVCSAADATLILCYAANGTWACSPGVSLSTPAMSAPLANVVHIGLGSTMMAGQVLTVPVTIADGPEFAGGTFAFQYDPNQLAFDAATLAALTNGFSPQSHVVQPGLVRVSLAHQSAVNGDGAILNLRFNVTGSASPIRVSDVRLNDAAGRDFATSALQKQIEIVIQHTLYLPLVRR